MRSKASCPSMLLKELGPANKSLHKNWLARGKTKNLKLKKKKKKKLKSSRHARPVYK